MSEAARPASESVILEERDGAVLTIPAQPAGCEFERGPLDVRLEFARRKGGSALAFLQTTAIGRAGGRSGREDPFPDLVSLARKSDRPVFLVPELVVWEKWSVRLKPAWADYVFGTPEVPGFLHSVLAFWRNHKRAQFRVGIAIDLKAYAAENPADSDAVVARKVHAALRVHLARETRAVFGPPYKPPERVIDETLRDRTLRQVIEQTAARSGKDAASLEREARRHLNSIAARLHPTVIALLAPIMGWMFDRIYDGIAVDEAGLERALQAARNGAPIVLCPSHKSHIDYLVMSWVLWKRGYQMPVVAAARTSPSSRSGRCSGAPARSSSGAASEQTASTPPPSRPT